MELRKYSYVDSVNIDGNEYYPLQRDSMYRSILPSV